MEGPQHASKLHTAFPPEIWGYITQYLSGEQIGRLKMTGSKTLWRRLTANRAVKSINLGKDMMLFKRWPAFLNELTGIEELEICNEDRNWWISWRPKLSQVPRTLRKLKIWSNRFLFKQTFGNFFVGSKNESLSLCDYVPELEVLQVRLHWCGKYAWMKRTPPNLKSLIVQKWTSTLALPASLTHFHSHVITVIQSDTFRLPPQLESISATLLDGFQLLVPALPPSIKSIVAETAYSNDADLASVMNSLPSSLTELHGLSSKFSDDFSEPTELVDVTFPSSLISYRTGRFPIPYWDRLPKSLQDLALSIDLHNLPYVHTTSPLTNQEAAVYVHPIHTLPESLTELELSSCTGGPFSIFPAPDFINWYFPPKLTKLNLVVIGLTVAAAKLLPSTLKELKLSKLDSGICEHLPRGLERLNALGALITPTLIAALPKGLKFLKLDNEWMDLDWKDPYTSQHMRIDEAISHLTKPEDVYWQQNATLPPTLTSVDIRLPYGEDASDFGDAFATQNLPNLKRLIIPRGREISDSSIPHLSRNLRLLNLSRCGKVTGKCFPDLPPSLTDVAIFGEVEDDDIQHLPASLIALRVGSASKLTAACIAHLPRQLEILALRQNECILEEDLPKRITMDHDYWGYS